MDEGRFFVGRKTELEQFKAVLEDPKGQAVLVVGHAGMGKTWLVNKMTEIADKHPEVTCGWVRYEVTPTDSVDSTMALMMDNAFEAAQIKEGSFNGTTRRLEQWRNLLNVINIGDLVMSLKRDPAKNTREQFLERLRLISKRMPKNGRAIFIIDPEKYMQKESDQSWAIVVKELPNKIKFIFAQRPEDELVKGHAIRGLKNIYFIPNGRLDVLEESSVDELIQMRADDVGKSGDILKKSVTRYKGHPYAISGALDIIKKTKSVVNLPQDPTPEAIAEAQWERICDICDEAVKLFEAYAILEVGVPDDVVEEVSGLSATTRKRLQKDSYLKGLLREEGVGMRIYHAILADYILGQISVDEIKEYHSQAVGVYREKLERAEKEQTRPDALASMRLAEHVLAAEGKEAFVDEFVNKCYVPLINLGLLDATIGLSERTLSMVRKGSEKEAMVTNNLALIYGTRGELDKAEKMHKTSLEIAEKLGSKEGMANSYGNLGLIYEKRDELDKAEEMFRDGLKIDEKLGRLKGMASKYGNLGNVYFTRRELDKAEEMHLKSLEMEKKLGRLEGIASQYVNLGNVYAERGELDKAEEMYLKSLEISEPRGIVELTASQYANLGLIYKEHGDVSKAKDYWEKALDLYKKIGVPNMVEKVEELLKRISNK